MEATRTFPADVTSPRAARQFVGALLGDPDGDAAQVALVLTSELVTNAVVHAGTPLDVRVSLDDDHMLVAVADGDPHLPGPMAFAADAVGGRGLRLVEQLATAWGTEVQPHGKVVWFALDTRAAPIGADRG